MKRKDGDSSRTNGRGSGEAGMIAIEEIKTHPTFVDLLPIAEEMYESLVQDMAENGFYAPMPLTLAR